MSARIRHVETRKTTNVVRPLTAMEIRKGIKTKAVPEIQAIAASFIKRLLVFCISVVPPLSNGHVSLPCNQHQMEQRTKCQSE